MAAHRLLLARLDALLAARPPDLIPRLSASPAAQAFTLRAGARPSAWVDVVRKRGAYYLSPLTTSAPCAAHVTFVPARDNLHVTVYDDASGSGRGCRTSPACPPCTQVLLDVGLLRPAAPAGAATRVVVLPLDAAAAERVTPLSPHQRRQVDACRAALARVLRYLDGAASAARPVPPPHARRLTRGDGRAWRPRAAASPHGPRVPRPPAKKSAGRE